LTPFVFLNGPLLLLGPAKRPMSVGWSYLPLGMNNPSRSFRLAAAWAVSCCVVLAADRVHAHRSRLWHVLLPRVRHAHPHTLVDFLLMHTHSFSLTPVPPSNTLSLLHVATSSTARTEVNPSNQHTTSLTYSIVLSSNDMQLISSLAGLLAGLVAANPLPASDSGPALAIASTPYVLGINATVGQHDTADGIIELCPQPDYKGDCFSWGYNQSMCCSYTRPPIVYVRQFTDEPVAADAFVGDVAIQSAVTLDLGQSGSSQCTLFR